MVFSGGAGKQPNYFSKVHEKDEWEVNCVEKGRLKIMALARWPAKRCLQSKKLHSTTLPILPVRRRFG
jgi:hypothetical protein